MRRSIASFLVFLCVAANAQAQQPKTYFDHLEDAWAVGEVRVSRPLKYRDGTLLAFPGRITELVHARVGRPQTIMIMFESRPERPEPPFEEDTTFFAPIRLLPQYSYWRDNLPKTPKHTVAGGSRYVFVGEDMAEAKRVASGFTATLASKRVDRWPDQGAVVMAALSSPIAVLREDAGRYLLAHPELLKAARAETREELAKFLTAEEPAGPRVELIAASAASGLRELVPTLEKLAKRNDEVGAAALGALDRLGQPSTTAALLERTRSDNEAMRAFAAEALAARAGTDATAFEATTETLASGAPDAVRAAAARGLGRAKTARSVEPLVAALMRGDEVSRTAALALAATGGPEAVSALKRAITDGPSEAQIGAVVAIVELESPCEDCLEFLRQQHQSHPDQAIRDLIGIVIEADAEHRH